MGNLCRNCGKKISFINNYYTMNYTGAVFCQNCSKEIIALLKPVQLLNSSKSLSQIEKEFHDKLDQSNFNSSVKAIIEDEFKNTLIQKKEVFHNCHRSFRMGFEETLSAVVDAGKQIGMLKKEPDVMTMGEVRIATCVFEKFYIRTGAWTALVVITVSHKEITSLMAFGTGGGAGLSNDSFGTEEDLEEAFFKNLEMYSQNLIANEIKDDYIDIINSDSHNDASSEVKGRIGVLGGTFDPVHLAHVALGRAAIEELDLEKLIVMPARVQPFKQGKKTADNIHRKTMAKLAFMNCDKAEVSDYEMERNTVSYSINTLMHLKKEYPDNEIFFICGTDSFIEMDKWYRGSEILSRFSFAVSIRPGYREEELNKKISKYRQIYKSHIVKINADMPPISSSSVREKISAKKTISDMVPPQVERYIKENDLYK
ncbi:MAG: nicotinate (nicotinamide) nucleotide adenylyltransferase [Clostridiales bacterium]|nr:MAG: nicotinate (nicotinamide) nucleotide adenylyltransferase [Clostridiales bacterium]